MLSKKRKCTQKIIHSLVPKHRKRCTNASKASTDENNTESGDAEEMPLGKLLIVICRYVCTA